MHFSISGVIPSAGTQSQIELVKQITPIFKGVDPMVRQGAIEMLMMMHVHGLSASDAWDTLNRMAERAKERMDYVHRNGVEP